MLRQLMVSVFSLSCLFATANSSFAGATGKSFNVDVSDGTKAAAAFNINGTVLVHVPGADVMAQYIEMGTGILVPSLVFGSTISAEYSGFFFANCSDPLAAPATLKGFGYGSTGYYTFKGAEK